MFEITYKENAITDPTFTDEGACYDFTFETSSTVPERTSWNMSRWIPLPA